MMYILGISCYYHDSAACILRDGKLIAAAEEERFTRIKHDNSFPINAINYCLKEAGISSENIDYVGFYEKPMLKFGRILETAVSNFPRSYLSFVRAVPEWVNTKLRLPTTIAKKLGYKGEVYFIDHHLSHAASAFFFSPFKESVILTTDGIGEFNSAGIYHGKGNKIIPLKTMKFPHSLGLFYSTITAFLGFQVNNDEYKVMGLAAYGKPSYYNRLKRVIEINEDGGVKLDMSYFDFEWRQRMYSQRFIKEFGQPRVKESVVTRRDMDLAASAQKLTEEAIQKMALYAKRLTNADYLCMAGGVVLNSKANGELLRKRFFKDIFFMPVAGDDGGCLGVAKYIWHSILGRKQRESLKHLYYGPGFGDREIEEWLSRNGIAYKRYDEENLCRITAEAIASDKVVGWFQGRMELGPRALGSRSILANPCNPNMKDIVNKKVKLREEFRPFAPAILAERASEYFEMYKDEAAYMIYTTYVHEEKRRVIPAVTHLDGTARPQTVTRELNPRYYRVIGEFSKIRGVPVVMNTSFNVRGEPIVCTPEDAYKCFMGTGIDLLVMGRCVVGK